MKLYFYSLKHFETFLKMKALEAPLTCAFTGNVNGYNESSALQAVEDCATHLSMYKDKAAKQRMKIASYTIELSDTDQRHVYRLDMDCHMVRKG